MVVTVGETLRDVPVTVPIPEILRDVAFDVVHARVLEFPEVIDVGEAVKEEIVGAGVGGGVRVVKVKLFDDTEFPSESIDVTLKLYVVDGEREERVIECEVVFVVLSTILD